MTSDNQLKQIREQIALEILRDDWETASQMSGMLSTANITSVLCTIEYQNTDGVQQMLPAVAIPVDQYEAFVRMMIERS